MAYNECKRLWNQYGGTNFESDLEKLAVATEEGVRSIPRLRAFKEYLEAQKRNREHKIGYRTRGFTPFHNLCRALNKMGIVVDPKRGITTPGRAASNNTETQSRRSLQRRVRPHL